jgi:protein-tyrosine phosphatase
MGSSADPPVVGDDVEIVWALVGFVVFMVVGNVAIAVASQIARRPTPNEPLASVAGVKHLHAVDTRVWRSSAPSRDAYAAVAGRGVRTVIDLRAERDLRDDSSHLAAHSVELVRLPIRDGQTPTPTQVETALSVIRSSEGIVLVHCGAGVGRTGTIAAAYLVDTGAATPRQAVSRNLAVGPPSLEQIWYVANLDHGFEQPPFAVKVVSRTLDAPRRIWSRVRHAR